jgi:hypothetical protein
LTPLRLGQVGVGQLVMSTYIWGLCTILMSTFRRSVIFMSTFWRSVILMPTK